MPRTITASLVLAACCAAGACTVQQSSAPPLTGPSELATSLSVTATPDTINQDGSSKSTVIITAHGASGQALAGLPVRVDMAVSGVTQDFGTLSARNLVTGVDGRTSVIYTAPPAPPPAAAGRINVVSIVATPVANDAATVVLFGGSSTQIRLTPIGVILPPADAPTPSFVISPTPVNINVEARFDASRSCPGAADANGNCLASSSQSIVSYAWDYGDGDTAVGQTQTHIYKSLGTFTVRLTVTNDRSISATATQVVSVGATAAPKAAFVFSPTAPVINETIQFNASVSTSTLGHDIVTYVWVFGDGTTGSGILTTHSYTQTGSYAVTLTVTDDTGQRSVAQQTINVGTGNPVAVITPSTTTPVHLVTVVSFDALSSTTSGGATIVSYLWDFGDPTSGSNSSTSASPTHVFETAGPHTVRVTITDDQGRSGTTTITITAS